MKDLRLTKRGEFVVDVLTALAALASVGLVGVAFYIVSGAA